MGRLDTIASAVRAVIGFSLLSPVTVFYKSEWENWYHKERQVSLPYFMYRFAYMLSFCCILAFGIICDSKLYYLYLSHWTILFQCLYSILFFGDVAYRFSRTRQYDHQQVEEEMRKTVGKVVFLESIMEIKRDGCSHLVPIGNVRIRKPRDDRDQPEITINQKIIWVLSTVNVTMPFGVLIGYWGFVYGRGTSDDSNKWCSDTLSILIHGVNYIMAFADFIIIALPVKLGHMIYPILFVFVYLTFTVFYEILGGAYLNPEKPYIYKILNWKQHPTTATLCAVVGLLLTGVLHVCLLILYRIRLMLIKKIKKEDVLKLHHVIRHPVAKTTPVYNVCIGIKDGPVLVPSTENPGENRMNFLVKRLGYSSVRSFCHLIHAPLPSSSQSIEVKESKSIYHDLLTSPHVEHHKSILHNALKIFSKPFKKPKDKLSDSDIPLE